jgi:hypothetical protein
MSIPWGVDALLEPGLVVDVVLDGGWRRTASVVRATPEAVDLQSVGAALVLPGQLRWCSAALEWRAGTGAVRAAGVVHRTDDADADLRLVPVAEPLKVQRRRFVRVPAELPAAVVAERARRVLARTVDVSVGGMLLADATALAVGTAITFALDLGTATVSGGGRVVRATPQGARGVEFAELSAAGERTLARFVAERQRRRLALAHA